MDDTKRFVRYLVPGAVFSLQTGVLLWILRPDWIHDMLPTLAAETGIGFAVVGLLGSGAIGFIFSIVYHELQWQPWLSTINYANVVRSLVGVGRLRLIALDSSGKESNVAADRISREVAWTALVSAWHCRLSQDPIKSAEPRAASLADLTHSLGTATVAAMGGLVTALLVAAAISSWHPHGADLMRFLAALAIALIVVISFGLAYRRTGRLAQSVIEQVFADAMYRELKTVEVRIQESMLPNTPLKQTSGRKIEAE